MLALHYLADEMNRQPYTEAERLRPSRQQAAVRRAVRRSARAPRHTFPAIRKAFQLRMNSPIGRHLPRAEPTPPDSRS